MRERQKSAKSSHGSSRWQDISAILSAADLPSSAWQLLPPAVWHWRLLRSRKQAADHGCAVTLGLGRLYRSGVFRVEALHCDQPRSR
jgi:hypothetical protein